jgi:hypothetical protein
MQALLIFRSTWDVVRAAAAIMNLLGGGKRIAKVATSRGRWCGPHNTSGQGCRCTTDRGHQYSRLHVGIPFSGRPRHSAAAGCASRIVGFQRESRRRHAGAAVALEIRCACRPAVGVGDRMVQIAVVGWSVVDGERRSNISSNRTITSGGDSRPDFDSNIHSSMPRFTAK